MPGITDSDVAILFRYAIQEIASCLAMTRKFVIARSNTAFSERKKGLARMLHEGGRTML